MRQSEEIDRFKFSIAALTALSTFAYICYNFVQNNAVNSNFYTLVIVIISSTIITILILIFSIFIKALSYEIKNYHQKEKIENFALETYRNSFLITIILIIYSGLFYYIYTTILNDYEVDDNVTYVLLILVAFSSFYFHDKYMVEKNHLHFFIYKQNIKKKWPVFNLEGNESIKNKISTKIINKIAISRNYIAEKIVSTEKKHPKLYKIFIKFGMNVDNKTLNFFMFSIFYLFVIYLITFLLIMVFTQGNVNIDVDRLHYKSSGPISVFIEVYGPDTGLLIDLLKENDGNLTLYDSIELTQIHNPNNTISGESSILMGNALDNGFYNIFINTTNLTEGYYELVCFRNYEYIKGFYLINQ